MLLLVKRKAEKQELSGQVGDRISVYICKNSPVCVVCEANVAKTKEDSVRHHYEMTHQDKYKDLDRTRLRQKVEEVKRGLVSHQSMLKKSHIAMCGCCKGELLLWQRRSAKSDRPFREGEVVKKWMMEVCALVWPEEKASAFKCKPEQKPGSRSRSVKLLPICATS